MLVFMWNHMHVSIYIYAVSHMYLLIFIYVSMTLFMCQFSIFGSYFLHMSASFSLTIHLHSEIRLWQYIYPQDKLCTFCDKYKHNLSKAITDDLGFIILALWSVCLSFYLWKSEFHIIIVLYYLCFTVGPGLQVISRS